MEKDPSFCPKLVPQLLPLWHLYFVTLPTSPINLATSADKCPNHTIKQTFKLYSLLLIKYLPFIVKLIEIMLSTHFLCTFIYYSLLTALNSGSCLQGSPGTALGKVTSDLLLDMYLSYLLDDFSAFDGWWLLPLSLNFYHTCLLWPQMQLFITSLCLLMKMLRLSKITFLALLPFYTDWEFIFNFAILSLTSAQTSPDSTSTYSSDLLDTSPF